MKTPALISVLLFITTLAFAQPAKPDHSLLKQWETGPGLKMPESVLYDSVTGIIYVSNVDGNPARKDSSGFIATISQDGTILNNSWVTGIDSPKGMGILNHHLFVTNIDEVVEIDIPTATIVKRYPVTGSKFLNDIAVDPGTGMIFITDTQNGEVYVLHNGIVNLWLQGPIFKDANGLFLDGSLLYIGTGNNILQADIQSGEVIVSVPNTGGVDGLFLTSGNIFIYSDLKGSIYSAVRNRKPELLLNTAARRINAADFGVIPAKNMILVPTFGNNKVMCYTSSFIK